MKNTASVVMSFLIISALFTTTGWTDPGSMVLKTVDKIELDQARNRLKITYTLPCRYDDWSKFVMTHDDSGDMAVAVGIVYSRQERNCKQRGDAGIQTEFSRLVDPNEYGYDGIEDAAEWVPMGVKVAEEKAKNDILKRHVVSNYLDARKTITGESIYIEFDTIKCQGTGFMDRPYGTCQARGHYPRAGMDNGAEFAIVVTYDDEGSREIKVLEMTSWD